MSKKHIAGIIMAGLFFVPSLSLAQTLTMEDITKQINGLIALIAKMQTQIASQSGGGGTGILPQVPQEVSTSCLNINNNLAYGSKDSSTNGQVTKLQNFLVIEVSYPTDSVTGFFGPTTERYVKKWQAGNAIVSYGNPDTTGYGAVGPKTRKAMGAKCGDVPISPVGPIVIPIPPTHGDSFGQPSITVISPNGGGVFEKGSTYNVSWETKNAPAGSFVEVSYYKDGYGLRIIGEGSPTDSESWFIHPEFMYPGLNVSGSDYKIEAKLIRFAERPICNGTCLENTQNDIVIPYHQKKEILAKDESDNFFTIRNPIDNEIPTTITAFSPANGAVLSVTQTFSWNKVREARGYFLYLGYTSEGYEIDRIQMNDRTSAMVDIPQNGREVYATVWYLIDNTWTPKHFGPFVVGGVVGDALIRARNAEKDAQIKASLHHILVKAELVYDREGNSYSTVCNDPIIARAYATAKNTSHNVGACSSTATTYVSWVGLRSTVNDAWCIDETGFAGQITKPTTAITSCKGGSSDTIAIAPKVTNIISKGLSIQYDSNKRESALVAEFEVTIESGSEEVTLHKGSLLTYVNNEREPSSYHAILRDNSTHSFVSSSGSGVVRQTGDLSYIIPLNTRATFLVTGRFNPKIMFAGRYNAYVGIIIIDGVSFSLDKFNDVRTNFITLVGETTPYITSIESPVTVGQSIIIQGERMLSGNNTVVVIDNSSVYNIDGTDNRLVVRGVLLGSSLASGRHLLYVQNVDSVGNVVKSNTVAFSVQAGVTASRVIDSDKSQDYGTNFSYPNTIEKYPDFFIAGATQDSLGVYRKDNCHSPTSLNEFYLNSNGNPTFLGMGVSGDFVCSNGYLVPTVSISLVQKQILLVLVEIDKTQNLITNGVNLDFNKKVLGLLLSQISALQQKLVDLQTGTPEIAPRVESIRSKSFTKKFDSQNNEAALVAEFFVTIKAGSKVVTLSELGKFTMWASNDSLSATSNKQREFNAYDVSYNLAPGLGGSAFIRETFPAQIVIPSGTSSTLLVKGKFNPKIMFAGNYTAHVGDLYLDGNWKVLRSHSGNTTTSLAVVGETTPYITSVTQKVGSGQDLVINGERLMSGINQVVLIDRATFIRADKSDNIFTIPANLLSTLSNGRHLLQIQSVDSVGNIVESNPVAFEVVNLEVSRPSITVLSPNGGEVFTRLNDGTLEIDINWRSSLLGNSNIKFILIGGDTPLHLYSVYNDPDVEGHVTLSMPENVLPGKYKFRIEKWNDSSLFDESNEFFEIKPEVVAINLYRQQQIADVSGALSGVVSRLQNMLRMLVE